jgi:hypothetical protein
MDAMGLRAVRAASLCAAAIGLCALVPASAPGASYAVWSCRGPEGSALSTRAWSAGIDPAGTSDTCADAGSLRAALLAGDGPSGLVRGWRFLLPAGATISGYRLELAASTAASDNPAAFQAGVAADAPLAVAGIDAGCPASGCTFGTFASPLDPGNLLTRDADSHGLVVGVRCGAILGCPAAKEDDGTVRAQARLFRSRVDIRDDALPAIAPGTVTTDTTTAVATVAADVSDAGGGVAAVALQVDGVEVERTATRTCREPYTEPAPCPGLVTASFVMDAGALAAGTHDVRVRGVDAAGNVITGPAMALAAVARPSTPGGPVTIDRPVPIAPAPVVITTARAAIALGGNGAKVTGVVRTPAGAPVAGAKVSVRGRAFGVYRSVLRKERELITDAAGRFSLPVAAPSRILRLDVDDATNRAVDPLEVDLLQRLKITVKVPDRSLHNGSRMTLRARIGGAGAGTAGKVVLVQSIVGGEWATVASVQAGRDGTAVWRYRFRGTTRPALYRFRVRVERAGDVWPWPTTNSAPVIVAVAP